MTVPDQDNLNNGERQAWARFRRQAGRPARGACPDALALAAYVDGRAGAVEAAAVEAHLADCADCLGAVGELRALAEVGLVMAPPAVVRAAKALVAGTAPEAGRRVRRPATRWSIGLRWAAAAVLALAVGGLGYGAGQSVAHGRQAVAASVAHEAARVQGENDEPPSEQDEVALLLGGEAL